MAAVHVTAIVAAGGRGLRFGSAGLKQLMPLRGRSVLEWSVGALLAAPDVSDVVVALPGEVADNPPAFLLDGPDASRITIVRGGARRQDSVARAFERVPTYADVVVIHDAARPLVSQDLIARTVRAAAESGAAIAAVPASDTVKRVARGQVVETLRREELALAQTPQAFRVDVLRAALALGGDATDEAALAERAGYSVRVVEGETQNLKVTTPDDLAMADRLLEGRAPAVRLRIGNGYDLHRLVAGRPLVLGGVTIPFDKGLLGHSDADAVAHAVTDAILGAAGAGDIGRHFPDSDLAWKDADSLALLARASTIVQRKGYHVVNVDVVIVAERPKIAPHVPAMTTRVARALGVDETCVSIKGKTNEGVDSMGAGESIAVHAVALIAG
jgi:2-C-methyl-D-erythritol 4-phosphate cytidylyltransferase/2-C-methyl-D-erythritol 2,4-cyclodiphosphate synthase